MPVTLTPTLTGEGPTIHFLYADDNIDYQPASILLRLRLEQWVSGDDVAVLWDGSELSGHDIRYCHIDDPAGISDVSSAVWQTYVLAPSGVSFGRHTVKAILRNRHPQLACDLILTDVELVVRYEANPEI